MASTEINSNLVVEQFRAEFFKEYLRANQFNQFMRADQNAIIHVVNKLGVEIGGKITIPLVNQLDEDGGVTGSSQLVGNEAKLDQYAFSLTVEAVRNAVELNKSERVKSNMAMPAAAKAMLRDWCTKRLRRDIIRALMTPSLTGVIYGTKADGTNKITDATEVASETLKDNYLEANKDRVLFGRSQANTVDSGTADHSASLANIDTTNDKLSVEVGAEAMRMAKEAQPLIRPYQLKNGMEFWVLFCTSVSFAQLKASTAIRDALKDGLPRGMDNPLFTHGVVYYDGIMYVEVPEIPLLADKGASTTDVSPNFLCGAQAVGLGWGQLPTPTRRKEDDYGFVYGYGIEEFRDVKKIFYNEKQHGVVTVYTSGEQPAA